MLWHNHVELNMKTCSWANRPCFFPRLQHLYFSNTSMMRAKSAFQGRVNTKILNIFNVPITTSVIDHVALFPASSLALYTSVWLPSVRLYGLKPPLLITSAIMSPVTSSIACGTWMYKTEKVSYNLGRLFANSCTISIWICEIRIAIAMNWKERFLHGIDRISYMRMLCQIQSVVK